MRLQMVQLHVHAANASHETTPEWLQAAYHTASMAAWEVITASVIALLDLKEAQQSHPLISDCIATQAVKLHEILNAQIQHRLQGLGCRSVGPQSNSLLRMLTTADAWLAHIGHCCQQMAGMEWRTPASSEACAATAFLAFCTFSRHASGQVP